MSNDELAVLVPGYIYNVLSEEEKNLVGKDYVVLRPTSNLDGNVEGLIALNVSESNLPDDYLIRINLNLLPENIINKIQRVVVTYPKNEMGFYEDIFGLYEKSNRIK